MTSFLLLTGLFLMMAMQIVIFVIALAKAPFKAFLCLLIPLYVYVYARREPKAKPFLLAWYAGVGLLALGVITAS